MTPAAKYAPAALLPWAGALPFDLMFVPFVMVAMIAAWMVRAGQRVANDQPWPIIRRDLTVSLLLGLGNAILAATIIARFDLTYLEGMGVAFFLALGGVETMKIGWTFARDAAFWFRDRLFESEGKRRQEAQRQLLQNASPEIEEAGIYEIDRRIARRFEEARNLGDDTPG